VAKHQQREKYVELGDPLQKEDSSQVDGGVLTEKES
jgi:hypothetical protein